MAPVSKRRPSEPIHEVHDVLANVKRIPKFRKGTQNKNNFQEEEGVPAGVWTSTPDGVKASPGLRQAVEVTDGPP
jgi:hypothetical protein